MNSTSPGTRARSLSSRPGFKRLVAMKINGPIAPPYRGSDGGNIRGAGRERHGRIGKEMKARPGSVWDFVAKSPHLAATPRLMALRDQQALGADETGRE